MTAGRQMMNGSNTTHTAATNPMCVPDQHATDNTPTVSDRHSRHAVRVAHGVVMILDSSISTRLPLPHMKQRKNTRVSGM